jgi:hypothetical protein
MNAGAPARDVAGSRELRWQPRKSEPITKQLLIFSVKLTFTISNFQMAEYKQLEKSIMNR